MMQTENPRARPHRVMDGDAAALLGVGGGERRAAPFAGVRALMLAMLEDAVRAYLGPMPRQRAEAEGWIDSGRSRWVFSFASVCETLGLEPSAVRGALRRMRDQPPDRRRFMVGKSRPNARQANQRIALPRMRRRAPAGAAGQAA